MALNHPLKQLQQSIENCQACSRLREYCSKISETKRRAYQNETYWGKPVPSWGDPNAKLMIVGLAPAAHGGNRTGRIFTGDRSGDWLYRALYKAGFSNQPTSTRPGDGLLLQNAYISCVVHCAPPDNKPLPIEQKNCVPYLKKELELLLQVRVWIALGRFAFTHLWPLLKPGHSLPQFKHGECIELGDRKWLLLSYHPSQQNTFTGKLTEPMFDSVFTNAKRLAVSDDSLPHHLGNSV